MAEQNNSYIPSEDFNVNKLIPSLAAAIKNEFYASLIGDVTDTFQSIENSIINITKQFGGGREMSKAIERNFADATIQVGQLGGTLKDIEAIQVSVIKATNTQTILNGEAYASLYATSKLIGDNTKDASQVVGEMIQNITKVGYGLYDTTKQLSTVIDLARQYGLSTTSIYSQLKDNISAVNLYNFDNGVQGLSKMSAQAAMVKGNISDTLKFAEKVFSPEKAIETAASFQRLGVQVSELLDPYSLMDMARNRPEDLQKSIIEATKELTYFDEKNNRISILPGSQERLRELAPVLDMSADKLAELAINSANLERKLKTIQFKDFMNEDDKTLIANLAQMKDGKYVIDVQGVEKDVVTLDEKDIEALKVDPDKSAIQLQRESNGSLLNIQNDVAAIKTATAVRFSTNEELKQVVKTLSEKAFIATETIATGVGFKRQISGEGEGLYSDIDVKNFINDKLGGTIREFYATFTGERSPMEVLENLKTALTGTFESITGFINDIPKNYEEAKKNMREIDPEYGKFPNDFEKSTKELKEKILGSNVSESTNNTNSNNSTAKTLTEPTQINLVHTHNININGQNLPQLVANILNSSEMISSLDLNMTKYKEEVNNLIGKNIEMTG
jgi:hypothetical protein